MACIFFLQGRCRNGSSCPFSHDLSRDDTTTCKYYLQGHCSYGDRCMFEHPRDMKGRGQVAKVVHPIPAAPHITNAQQSKEPAQPQRSADRPGGGKAATQQTLASAWARPSTWAAAAGARAELDTRPDHTATRSASAGVPCDDGAAVPDGANNVGGGDQQGLVIFDDDPGLADPWGMAGADCAPESPSQRALCDDYLLSGWCPRDDSCPFAHGSFCCCCETYALHPFNEAERSKHEAACLEALHRSQQLAASAELECVVCLERVLDKKPSARKFGLMACEHVFCLGCIRAWRDGSSGADLEAAVRTCPVCRVTTRFVTPSPVWPSSQDEKDEIIERYKSKLASVHCRHFDRGRGTCPFSTSCFYRHELEDGTLQDREVSLGLRTVLACDGDGRPRVLQPLNMAAFIEPALLTRRPLRQ